MSKHSDIIEAAIGDNEKLIEVISTILDEKAKEAVIGLKKSIVEDGTPSVSANACVDQPTGKPKKPVRRYELPGEEK